ncbi:MAG: hypothetical protein ACQEQE_04255 [Bacillota bacterium]
MLKKYLRVIIEITIINILFYTLFFRFTSNIELFFQLNPNPFLLIVILYSLFYGNKIGLVITLITIIFHLIFFKMYIGNLKLFISDLTYFKYPLLYLWTTVIIGGVIDQKEVNYQVLKDEFKLNINKYNRLNKSYNDILSAFKDLKGQIISSDESIISLYSIAKKLKTLQKEEIYTEAIGIISKYLKADIITIYTYNENSNYLRVKLRKGISKIEENMSLNLDENEELFKVINQKKVFRYTDSEKENFPILAGPLIEFGKPIGLITIEKMDFDKISNYAYILFKVILDWINLSFDNAGKYEGKVKDKYYNDSNVMRYQYFKEHLESEKRRKREYNLNYLFVKFKVDQNIFKVSRKIKKSIRDLDVVSYNENIIYLLLPSVPLEMEEIVKEKIYSRIDINLKELEIDR